jgi:glycosyltransferase involved in cell wall biosynthesis
LVRNAENLGLTRSLNKGLDLSAGQYVARMDADDIAAPERLERQVEFLHAHPGVGVVGSARTLIDETGAFVASAPAPHSDVRIRWKCLLGNPFAHAAVMLRREVLDTHGLRYDESFRTAQDYDLWSRMLGVTSGHNLADALLSYRLRNGVSRVHKSEQLRNHDRIAYESIRRLVPGFQIGPEEVSQLRGRFGGFSVREPAKDPADRGWVDKYLSLLDAFVAQFPGDADAESLAAEVRRAAGAAQGVPPFPSVRG